MARRRVLWFVVTAALLTPTCITPTPDIATVRWLLHHESDRKSGGCCCCTARSRRAHGEREDGVGTGIMMISFQLKVYNEGTGHSHCMVISKLLAEYASMSVRRVSVCVLEFFLSRFFVHLENGGVCS